MCFKISTLKFASVSTITYVALCLRDIFKSVCTTAHYDQSLSKFSTRRNIEHLATHKVLSDCEDAHADACL